ncbi:MAG: hypothetical protein AABX34_01495 [Nanoarchaeota archaeon]
MPKCPYCGRKMTEHEMYCWNCEQDVSKIKNKSEKPGHEEHEH